MSMYLNIVAEPVGRMAVDIGTPKGVADFTAWAKALPSEFALVRELADKGEAPGSKTLREQLSQAIKTQKPKASAKAVALRIHEVYPHIGTAAISDEPDDSELDED